MDSPLTNIVHVIQLAVAPVFLLTALATLINTLNGRLGRIVDRRREILGRPEHEGDAEADEELARLARRVELIYFAIFFSVLSALLVCLVVAGAFIGALIQVDLAEAVALLFVLAMLAMIVGLTLLLREIFLAVRTRTHVNR